MYLTKEIICFRFNIYINKHHYFPLFQHEFNKELYIKLVLFQKPIYSPYVAFVGMQIQLCQSVKSYKDEDALRLR